MNTNINIKNNAVFSNEDYKFENLLYENQNLEATYSLVQPSLADILKEFGPLPEGALLLGLADDGRPVLLNLLDPTPGPILIIGDSNIGKTKFLKALARYVVTAHQSREIQYGVITNKNYEWADYLDYPHTIGVFSVAENRAINLIQALSLWIEMKKSNQQTVLLLIDGLDDFLCWNDELKQEFQKILLSGPSKNVWPIATINREKIQGIGTWLNYFHTQVLGYGKNIGIFDNSSVRFLGTDMLSKGIEFAVKEGSQWIKFQIPSN